MKTNVLIFCLFIFGLTSLNGQIVADSIPYKLELLANENVKVLRADKETSFENIRQKTSWLSYDSLYKPELDTSIWLQFIIENTSQKPTEIYLYSLEDYITVYVENDRSFKELKNGVLVPLSERANKSEHFFTPLGIGPQEKSIVYIKLETNSGKAIGSPVIYSERGYWEFSRNLYKEEESAIGFLYLYIVSLITIFVFTLVFWIRLSEKLYFYYLGYLFFQLVYGFLVLKGTMSPFGDFINEAPVLVNNLMEPVQFIFIGFYVFFIQQLLVVKKYDKLLERILYYLGLFCFLYAITNFVFSHLLLDAKYMEQMFLLVRFIILPINFILIIWIIYKVKHPLLIYFIVGQTFFFVGAILSTYLSINNVHLIPGHIFNFTESLNIVFQVGLLAEVYCFSLALGKNVFLLQKEKEEINVELIKQLKENQEIQERMNRKLDKKVSQKSYELLQLYSEIEKEREQKTKDDFNKKLKETEMIALRSQMNPHFIFNSMNAIKSLIMTSRNEDAITYLDDFSSLLRSILYNSNLKKITVEEELEILELYLSLEQSRMGKEFVYFIEVASKEALSQYSIPPLLLQPIVENAIWHGLQPSLKSLKKLTITFDTTENLKIIIEDNGVGREASAKKKKLHTSKGTSIVHDRLKWYNFLNDYKIYLTITDLVEVDGSSLGTRITLTYDH